MPEQLERMLLSTGRGRVACLVVDVLALWTVPVAKRVERQPPKPRQRRAGRAAGRPEPRRRRVAGGSSDGGARRRSGLSGGSAKCGLSGHGPTPAPSHSREAPFSTVRSSCLFCFFSFHERVSKFGSEYLVWLRELLMCHRMFSSWLRG